MKATPQVAFRGGGPPYFATPPKVAYRALFLNWGCMAAIPQGCSQRAIYFATPGAHRALIVCAPAGR
jgi:hypothetical protein